MLGKIIVVIGIVAISLVFIGIAYGCECAECNGRTENIGFEHRYMFPFGGCQIMVNGSWIPLDNYRFLGD